MKMAKGSLLGFVISGAAALAVATLLGSATPALADGCVDIPNGTGGTQLYCGPLMGERSAPLPPATHYAAIYYDEATHAFGTSWGYGSEPAAKRAALQRCQAYGGRNCQWATSGQNLCFALAIGSNGAWAPDYSGSPERAKAKAIATCRKNGGADCQVPKAAHPCSED
jgi:hypothetical protein